MPLAKETIQPNEEKHTQAILQLLRDSLEKEYPNGKFRRRFHPKGHGLLKAKFKILADVPTYLKHGLFAKPEVFDAWIRFSNAPPVVAHDVKGSAKGLAIKVIDTGHETLEPDVFGQTQDFVLTTNEVLVPSSVKRYLASIKSLFGGFWTLLLYVVNPLHWRDLFILAKGRIKPHSLLDLEYHSGTAYLVGEGTAVKWMVRPQKRKRSSRKSQRHDHHLRANLQKDLQDGSHVFDFGVRRQTHSGKEPIENTGKRWKSPFIKLGELHLPEQIFDLASQHEKGEKMRFSPWHCMAEHRPLGGNNRVRRVVYREMAEMRKNRSPE